MKAKLTAEFLGTAFLLMVVVGSGIMGEALASGTEAVALLANSLATGAGLFVLIQCLGPVSGAHFNPVVSLVENLWGRLGKGTLFAYWSMQFAGAILGVWLAHGMFGKAIFQISQKDRSGPNLWLSEIIATFGLLCTIDLAGRKRIETAPTSVALYIVAAYWFTSSTSFANPAVTLARALTNTFCGVAPGGVLPFIFAQILGGWLAFWLLGRLSASK
ncbi:MIP family protein [Bacteroidia bacterium]|jgi:glycerol uptake facilitator-like aquaporin|nr:MIP family protein [Bacteroidia bacterium]